jgi:hypothetical protein
MLQRALGNQSTQRLIQRMSLEQALKLVGTGQPVWAFLRQPKAEPFEAVIRSVDASGQTALLAQPSGEALAAPVPLANLWPSRAEALERLLCDGPTSVESLASVGQTGEAPKQVTEQLPLFKIIGSAAQELGLDVFELEMRLGPPDAFLYSVPPERKDLLGGTFRKLVEEYYVQKQQLTNSCGQTSEWLERITAADPNKLVESRLKPAAFIATLRKLLGGHWLCRAASGSHSFMLECFGDVLYLYQSWHGKHALGHVLVKGPKAWQPSDLLPQLECVLTTGHMGTSRNVFFGQLLHPESEVTFTVNEHPLAPRTVAECIKASLQAHEGAWKRFMADPRTVQQLFAEPGLGQLSGTEIARLRTEGEKEPKKAGPSTAQKVSRGAENLSTQIGMYRRDRALAPNIEVGWSELKAYLDGKGMQSQYTGLTADELTQVLNTLIDEWYVLKRE